MSKIVDIIVRATAKTGAATKDLKGFGGKIKKAMAGVVSLAKKAALSIAGIGASLVVAAKRADEFNRQVGQVATLADMNIGAVKKQVRAMSAEFGLAKDELTKGLYDAISAGVPKENAFEFLRVAAKGAIAGAATTAESVDILSSAMNAFKIPASEAESVSDSLFATVKLGKTTLAELSQSFAQVGPIASASGVQIEQVLAAVATLTKQGTPTAQAMTQIRAAIIAMNENLGDGWTKTMTLQEGMVAMSEAAGGSTSELKKLTGRVEGTIAILGATGKNAAGAAADLDALTGSAGATNDAFKTMDSVTVVDKAMQSLDNIMLKLGDVTLAVFGEHILALADKMQAFAESGNLEKWARNAVTMFTDLHAAIKPFLGMLTPTNVKLALVAGATYKAAKAVTALKGALALAKVQAIALKVALLSPTTIVMAGAVAALGAITRAAIDAMEATKQLEAALNKQHQGMQSVKERFGTTNMATIKRVRKVLEGGDETEIERYRKVFPEIVRLGEIQLAKKRKAYAETDKAASAEKKAAEEIVEMQNEIAAIEKQQLATEEVKTDTIKDAVQTKADGDTVALESATEVVEKANEELTVQKQILATKKESALVSKTRGGDSSSLVSQFASQGGGKSLSLFESAGVRQANQVEQERIKGIVQAIREAMDSPSAAKDTAFLQEIAANTAGMNEKLDAAVSMT